MREAKQQTSWTQQNKKFEDALKLFIERLLDSQQFTADLEEFVSRLVMPGRVNSLSQTLIKFTAPACRTPTRAANCGICGSSIPTTAGQSYELRQSMLAELRNGMAAEELLKRMNCGLPKLWVTYSALQVTPTETRMVWHGRCVLSNRC